MSASKNIEILSNLNDDPQNLEAEQTVLGSILLKMKYLMKFQM